MEKREKELTTLFKKLYEDFALERINEDIFNSLSSGYLDEQNQLKEQIPSKRNELTQIENATKSSDTFIAKANKYIVLDELTSELLNIFIDKIVIHEREIKYSRSAVQMIDIHYLDVGLLDFENDEQDRKQHSIPNYDVIEQMERV